MTQQTSTPQAADTDVRIVISVAAPIERAFEVFTARIDTWWPGTYRFGAAEGSHLVLEPQVGGRWYERTANGKEYDWGNVLDWDPPRRLVLSWQIGVGFMPESNPTRASRVEVRFVEDGPAQTTVTLVHTGFQQHGEGWESLRDHVAQACGWPGLLETYAQQAIG